MCPLVQPLVTEVVCLWAGAECPGGFDPVLARLMQPWLIDSPSASSALLFSVQMAAESSCRAAYQLLMLTNAADTLPAQVSGY